MKIEMESLRNLNDIQTVSIKSQSKSTDQNNNQFRNTSFQVSDQQNSTQQKDISNKEKQCFARDNLKAIKNIILSIRDDNDTNNDNKNLVKSQNNILSDQEHQINIEDVGSFHSQHNKQFLLQNQFHFSYICSLHKLPIEYIAINSNQSHYYQNCCRKCVLKQQRTNSIHLCKEYDCFKILCCVCQQNQQQPISIDFNYFEVDELLIDYTFSFKKFIIIYQESLDLIQNVLQIQNQNYQKQDTIICFQKLSKNLKNIISQHMKLMGLDLNQFSNYLQSCSSEYSYLKNSISFESIHQCMNFLLNEQKQWEDQLYQIECFIDSQFKCQKNKRKNQFQENNSFIQTEQDEEQLEFQNNSLTTYQQYFSDEDLIQNLNSQIKVLFLERFNCMRSSLLSQNNITHKEVRNKISSCIIKDQFTTDQNELDNNLIYSNSNIYQSQIQTQYSNQMDFEYEKGNNILQPENQKQLEFEQNSSISIDYPIKIKEFEESKGKYEPDEFQCQIQNFKQSVQQIYTNNLIQVDSLNSYNFNQKDLNEIQENKILSKDQSLLSYTNQYNQIEKQEQYKQQFNIDNFSCKDIDDVEFIHCGNHLQNVNITYFDFNERYGIFYTMANIPKMYLFDFQNKKIDSKILQNVIQKQELNQIMIVKISSTEIAVWQEEHFQEIIIFNIYSKKSYKFRYAPVQCFDIDEFGQNETEINLFSIIQGSTIGIQLNNNIHMINYKKKKTIRVYDLLVSKHPMNQQNSVSINFNGQYDHLQQNATIKSLGNFDESEQEQNQQQQFEIFRGQNYQSSQFQTQSEQSLDVVEQFEEFKVILNKRTNKHQNCIHQNTSDCQICTDQKSKKSTPRYHLYMRSEKRIWQMELNSGRINQWMEKENSEAIQQRFYPINENKWFFYKDTFDEQWITVYKNQLQQGEYLSLKMMEFEKPILDKYWPLLDANNRLQFFDFNQEQFHQRSFDIETLILNYQKHLKMLLNDKYPSEISLSLFDNIDSYCFVKTFRKYLVLIQLNGDIYFIK